MHLMIIMPPTTTQMPTDPFRRLKEQQKQGWSLFAPLETFTIPEAAHLVDFAGIRPGQTVLDVATGTAPVAITAARRGAKVTALDLTPELLARARENAQLAEVDKDITFHEGDAEALPFPDASFDVVVSEYGHMFAPRHDVVMDEMLRVLRPGGTIAFSTWPPHGFTGLTFALVARYMPPPPAGAGIPLSWGDPAYVRERLADRVHDIVFDSGTLRVPALSPNHFVALLERSLGPVAMVVGQLQDRPQELAAFRREYGRIAELYRSDNVVRHDYLMTRAIKG